MGKYLLQCPGIAHFRRQRVKFVDHLFVVGAAAPANGEHAGGIAHAHALLSCQLPVQETCQRRKKRNLLYMWFPVQHGLIQMGNTPALGNIEAKQGGQLFRSLFRHGISPGSELRQLVSLCVKGKIAVHHTGNANGPHLPDGLAEALLNLPLQVRATGPESLIDLVHGIGPDPIDQLVFPGKAARNQRPEIPVHQHCLDSGRTQFNTEDRILQLHMFPLFSAASRRCPAASAAVPASLGWCPCRYGHTRYP